MSLNLRIREAISDCRSILLAGMGGGFDVFCGLPFYLDKRAYATDPEVAPLVEAVVAWARMPSLICFT